MISTFPYYKYSEINNLLSQYILNNCTLVQLHTEIEKRIMNIAKIPLKEASNWTVELIQNVVLPRLKHNDCSKITPLLDMPEYRNKLAIYFVLVTYYHDKLSAEEYLKLSLYFNKFISPHTIFDPLEIDVYDQIKNSIFLSSEYKSSA